MTTSKALMGYVLLPFGHVTWSLNTNATRQSEMADLARRATSDLSQFHMGGPNFDTGRSWKL